MTDPEDLIPAATVILTRNGPDGIETLMLKRNSKIAFGGAWVFPGGRVDDADWTAAAAQVEQPGETEVARVAAAREALEETGLAVSADGFEIWAHWVPPRLASIKTSGPRRRFSTWFFVAAAPEGDVTIDGGEIHEHDWLSPGRALALHAERSIELVPPTWVTLTQLGAYRSTDDLLQAARSRDVDEFHTEPLGGKPPILVWRGDAEHSTTSGVEGVHRAVLHPDGWIYERSF